MESAGASSRPTAEPTDDVKELVLRVPAGYQPPRWMSSFTPEQTASCIDTLPETVGVRGGADPCTACPGDLASMSQSAPSYDLTFVHRELLAASPAGASVERFPSEDDEEDTGDAILWTVRGGMRCLVVVHIRQEVRASADMHGFATRALSVTSYGTVDACMMVALHAPSIPYKGDFSIDAINGFPCVYVADVQRAPRVLTIAACSLMHCWRQCMALTLNPDAEARHDREIEQTNQLIREAMGCYRRVGEGFAVRRRSLEVLSAQLERDEQQLSSFMCRCDGLRRQLDWLDDGPIDRGVSAETTLNKVTMDRLIGKVLCFYEKHSHWPRRHAVNISESEARSVGGFKGILARAQARYVNRG